MRRLISYIKNLGVLAIVPFLGLIPVIWFFGKEKGVLINGIDTNFPLDPLLWLSRRFYVWNDDLNAGLDFSSSVAGIFFHFIQTVSYILGFDLQLVELFSLIFWFCAIVISSLFFAITIFGKKFIPVVVFVVLYSFNIYLFNTWENVKVANLALVSALPLSLAILQKLKNGSLSYTSGLILMIISSLLISGSGINPAYFLSFFVIILLFYLGNLLITSNWHEIKRQTLDLVLFSGVLILLNLFWILPTANFIMQNIRPEQSIDVVGYTNWLDSLSENTSILNIMRVQGAWDWYAYDSVTNLPLYIPYSLNYFYKFPFLFFSFLLPGLVIAALILRRRGYPDLYFSFLLMFVIGVFLGVGTYLPTGELYRVLVNKIPFFSLFRSPWYIFTPLVTLSMAGLVGLLLAKLERLSFRGIRLKYVAWLFGLIIVMGNFFYNYPLVTGKIFRPGREDTFFISFPPYVFETKSWLDQSDTGRILTYPDDEIEKFTWKYRGIESILQLISDKEILFLPLNAPDTPAPKILKELYQFIKKGELVAAETLAYKLSTSTLFEKADQPSLSFKLPLKIKERLLAKFDSWSFYKFPVDHSGKIYVANSTYLTGQKQDKFPKILATFNGNTLLTYAHDTVLESVLSDSNFSGFALLANNLQENDAISFINSESKLSDRLLARDLSQANFRIDIPKEGYYKPVLERYKLEDFGLSPEVDLPLKHNNQDMTLVVQKYDDSFIYYLPVFLQKGLHAFSFAVSNTSLIAPGQVLTDFYREGQGEFKVLGTETDAYLEILNRDTKDTSAVFDLKLFDPLQLYMIQLKYRQIYGNNASVIVGQNTTKTLVKVQVERLPNHPEWNYFSFYYKPVATDSAAKVGLIAPFTADPLGTKISYGDLQVYKVFTNSLVFLEESLESEVTAKASYDKISPVFYKGKVQNADNSHFLMFAENYSPEWELTIIDATGKRRKMDSRHLSANLFANAWYITDPGNEYSFEIFYKPQRFFTVGGLISIFTLLILFLLIIPRGKLNLFLNRVTLKMKRKND